MGWGSGRWEGCNRLRKTAGSGPFFPSKDQRNQHSSYGKPVDGQTPIVLEGEHNVQDGRANKHTCHTPRGKQQSPSSRREIHSFHFSSVSNSYSSLCNPMYCNLPGFHIHCVVSKFSVSHILCVGGTILPSHPVLSPSFPAFNFSQHQGLFK